MGQDTTSGQDLWRWDAVDLARAIRLGHVSCREAVQSCLARLEQVNGSINAVVDVMAAQALAEADRADDAKASGARIGRLHGVPVTIKVNVDTRGQATTNGVEAFAELIAREDSPQVANWRKEGAIVIGRTNTPAFSWRWFTDNALHGRTFNPWNPDFTPGGSSGGAAAAVAAGIGPLAHGNDIGGSIRYPAYACGVAGIKPSFGRVPAFNATAPEERPLSAQLIAVQGPIARHVRDLRIGLATMAMADARDPWWVPAPLITGTGPCRVALFAQSEWGAADPAVIEHLRRAALWLEDAGYRIEERQPPHFWEAAELWSRIVINEARSGMIKAIMQLGDPAIRKATSDMLVHVPELDLVAFQKALARRATILRAWQQFQAEYPLILMPVSWAKPFPADHDQQDSDTMGHIMTCQSPLLAVALLGLPGVSVPTGLVDGLPMGVQIVGPRFGESLCLDAAEVIEAKAGLETPIDPRGGQQARP